MENHEKLCVLYRMGTVIDWALWYLWNVKLRIWDKLQLRHQGSIVCGYWCHVDNDRNEGIIKTLDIIEGCGMITGLAINHIER